MVIIVSDLFPVIDRLQLSSLCPGKCSISFFGHISNWIILHDYAIPLHQFIPPYLSEGSGFCCRWFCWKRSCCIWILTYFYKISTQIILIGECLLLRLAVFPDQTVQLIVYIGFFYCAGTFCICDRRDISVCIISITQGSGTYRYFSWKCTDLFIRRIISICQS